MNVTIGSLCSGIGGLELGVESALGATTAWQAEIDPHASKVLAEHWPGVPNIGDIRDLTAMTPVDILTAGYPCQPFSTAGRRKGTDDPRHLWPAVHAAIAHLGPRLVVLENVRGHLTLGFGRVLGDLADIGYDAEWRVVRASDVGCCHQRARLFVAAYPASQRTHEEVGRVGSSDHCFRQRSESLGDSGITTHPEGTERRATQPDAIPAAAVGPAEPTDSRFGPYAAAVRRHEVWHGPAPDPTTDGRLNPRFVEWMMGYPAGWVDAAGSRNNQLRCLGNAVVPQVAAAFCAGFTPAEAVA